MPKYTRPVTPSASTSTPGVHGVKILNDARITVNAADPVVIMSVEFELSEASRVVIEGVVNGSFYHVCGLAAYVDDEAINPGTGNNRCHPDCFQITYGNGNNNFMCPIPYKTVTEELSAGAHKVDIAVIGKWAGTNRAVYINNRASNDMASTSSLIVREI